MTTREFLEEVLNGYAEALVESLGRAEPGPWVDRIINEWPEINDHAGEKGYWNTSDVHGNISGPFDTREDAIEHGYGWPYWCEAEEDEEEPWDAHAKEYEKKIFEEGR